MRFLHDGYRLFVASAVFGVLGAVSVLASPPADRSPEPGSASPPSVDDLVRRAIEYHDPEDHFLSRPHRLSFRETRPDGEERDVEVEIDVPGERFLYRRRDGTEIVRIVNGGECEALVDGRAPSPAEVGELRLDCERTLWFRDYYTFLWGLPMKLRDPGTRLGPLENDRFEGRPAWRLRVTWEEDVGGDVWYLYFDPASVALVGYRFYHDEAKGDGEVIVLTGEVRGAGLRLPAERAWTTHLDDRYLGTDVLTEIEALEP